VTDELTAFDLAVDGASPTELDGWYLRNGPNPRQATQHWFTGDGMIHGVRIEGGHAAWYRNRWVRTDSFNDDFPLYNADGTRNLRAQGLMTGALSFLVFSGLLVIVAIDRPFSGPVKVRPEAFVAVLEDFGAASPHHTSGPVR